MITIKSMIDGTCILCGEVEKCLDLKMDDGSIQGHICLSDFKKLVTARCYVKPNSDKKSESKTDDKPDLKSASSRKSA